MYNRTVTNIENLCGPSIAAILVSFFVRSFFQYIYEININPIALRKAKIVYIFGLSESNRVKPKKKCLVSGDISKIFRVCREASHILFLFGK